MVQLSAFSLFPATKKPSPLPDLTVKLTPTGPIKTEQPLGGNSRYSIQFNFESLKLWAQFVFMFTGATEIPPNAMSYGVDAMPVEIQVFGGGGTGEYVALQPSPVGGIFPATGLDPLEWAKGTWYILLKLASHPDGTKTVHVEVRDQATDNVLWQTGSTASTQFPDFVFGPEQDPMVFGVEAVGEYSGYATKFLSCDVRVDVEAEAPVYAVMQGDAAIWTYDDGVNGTLPLALANETGESSNLWTNVVGQSATSLILDLALAEGSQTFTNPPLAPPTLPPAPTPTCTYPVDVSSDPACIFQAFQDSGYWGALQVEVNDGILPPGYLTRSKAAPASWLKGHPFLGVAYPKFFKTGPLPPNPISFRLVPPFAHTRSLGFLW